jgi:hypothetical protein
MSRSNRLFWMEMVAVLSIVASLLALVYEIRSNTDAMAAQSVAELNRDSNDGLRLMTSDDGSALLEAFMKAQSDPASLTDKDGYRLFHMCWATGNTLESAWTFWEKRMISNADYAIWKRGTCAWFKQPQCEGFWAQNLEVFNPRFISQSRTACGVGASNRG